MRAQRRCVCSHACRARCLLRAVHSAPARVCCMHARAGPGAKLNEICVPVST